MSESMQIAVNVYNYSFYIYLSNIDDPDISFGHHERKLCKFYMF